MANQRHVDILVRDGVKIWNMWRKEEPEIVPDLSGADLPAADLSDADLHRVNLQMADLRWANLQMADLRWANLFRAHLDGAHLDGAHLDRAHLFMAHLPAAYLSDAYLSDAYLSDANLVGADLRKVDLSNANLTDANLSDAYLYAAHLRRANLTGANLTRADLTRADLVGADLVGVNLSGADLRAADLSRTNLTDCAIYGVSAWDVNLQGAIQANLRITPLDQPAIMVDNLEVAQFLYLLLHNDKARAVLDTITSKVVLILGRFGEHKAYLDAVREALRTHPSGYIPILFDFDPQADRPILETVKILANLARFIIADLTDPRMVRAELTAIIPSVPTVPVQPIVEVKAELPTEYASWALYRSFLPLYRYADLADLLAHLTESVIEPAEGHVQARRLSDGSSGDNGS